MVDNIRVNVQNWEHYSTGVVDIETKPRNYDENGRKEKEFARGDMTKIEENRDRDHLEIAWGSVEE